MTRRQGADMNIFKREKNSLNEMNNVLKNRLLAGVPILP
jgi:hypothetical protein